jgi:cell division protein FtsN
MVSFSQQRGNTVLGFILGLVVGLIVALVVAIYVTKVPIPFMNKGLSRNAEQDAAEQKRTKTGTLTPRCMAKTLRPMRLLPINLRSILLRLRRPHPAAESGSSDPLGDLAQSKTQAGEAFQYFVQVGAFNGSEEAQTQRAKLAMAALTPKFPNANKTAKSFTEYVWGRLRPKPKPKTPKPNSKPPSLNLP